MAPPLYADLDKKTKDIFTKGYNFGLLKLDCKTRTASGIEFAAGGNSSIDTGKVFGNLETKYKLDEHGITLTEKWNTDNQLLTDITFQKDSVLQGVKAGLETTFAPSTGQKSGRVKGEYRHDLFSGNLIADVVTTGPQINASGVVGQDGFFAGGHCSFDTSLGSIIRSGFGLAYDVGNIAVVGNITDTQECSNAIYYQVNGDLETGVQLSCSNMDVNTAKFGVGLKYRVNSDGTFGAKLNNYSQLGLSYQQRLHDGVTGTISALIDGKNLSQGGHKIGLALDVEV